MKKKTFINSLAIFCIATLLPCAFTSCSDDDDAIDTTEEVDVKTTIASCEVDVNYDETELTLSAVTGDTWHARIVSENADWLSLPLTEGTSNIEVMVDPNTTVNRRVAVIAVSSSKAIVNLPYEKLVSAEIYQLLPSQAVVDGAESIWLELYTVTQNTLYEASDENDIDYAVFQKNKVPLGYGMSIKKTGNSILPKASIFNLAQFGKLSEDAREELGMSDEYVFEDDVETTDIELVNGLQYANQKQGISATLKVTVGFGLAKLGLSGGFNLDRGSSDSTYSYSVATSVPCRNYILDAESYMNAATEADVTSSSMRTKVLSSQFTKTYDRIVACFDESGNVTDQSELTEALAELDNKFGPVFCSGGDKGGTINISAAVTQSEGCDTMTIDGKLTATFSSAFSLDAEATANYSKETSDMIKSITTKISIKGGDTDSVSSIIAMLPTILTNPENLGENSANLIKSINGWKKSLTADNCGLSDWTLTGIWTVFKHPKDVVAKAMQKAVKEYMKAQYPNTITADGKSSCPYLVDIQAMDY